MAMGRRFRNDCIKLHYSIAPRRGNPIARLDLATKLAEYARMDVQAEASPTVDRPPPAPRLGRSRRTLWRLGALVVAVLTAVAFGAYRQPELLLNLMGLRYCG
jgi:hypothetical protein